MSGLYSSFFERARAPKHFVLCKGHAMRKLEISTEHFKGTKATTIAFIASVKYQPWTLKIQTKKSQISLPCSKFRDLHLISTPSSFQGPLTLKVEKYQHWATMPWKTTRSFHLHDPGFPKPNPRKERLANHSSCSKLINIYSCPTFMIAHQRLMFFCKRSAFQNSGWMLFQFKTNNNNAAKKKIPFELGNSMFQFRL